MNQRGQTNIAPILQYPIVLLILGILLFALWPMVQVFWDLNTNTPGYDIAWSIMGLIPILAVVGVTVLYLVTRPRENPGSV